MRRPKAAEVWEDVLMETAKELVKSEQVVGPVDDVFVELAAVSSPGDSGYELAKALERRYCWEVSMDILEILDSISVYEPLRKAEATWVKASTARLTKKVGAAVQLKHGGKMIQGEIITVDAELCKYTVCCPSLGHVKGGLGTNGFLINAEDIDGLEFAQKSIFDELAVEA